MADTQVTIKCEQYAFVCLQYCQSMSDVAFVESVAASEAPPSPLNASVLVVDDHTDIREPLAEYLRRRGLRVDTAASAVEMRGLLSRRSFDLIVLDIMLPDEDGLSLCRFVVRTLGTPIIFLTAMAALHQRVVGLETGADDYVVKPFDPAELVARIRTVLRRQARAANPHAGAGAMRFGFEGWIFDMSRRELFDRAGRQVMLSEVEFRMLDVLVAHPNVVLTRERLLDLTQRGDLDVFDRSVDTQISRLRRKLEDDPRRPTLIKTAWGNGYLFAADVRALAA
jgi:two-component system OmpR family response regulator